VTAPLATARLREARQEIRARLSEIAARAGRLPSLPLDERDRERRALVDALDEALRPHLEWEERAVHPIVDRLACEGPATFSACMRYEHEIIHRWSGELAKPAPGEDATGFVRRLDNLLGVLAAHFELEEEVLFPILDRAFTPHGFDRALDSAQAGGGSDRAA
jgi:iron-sulfur cluster repair protein YtfE (RIC family)